MTENARKPPYDAARIETERQAAWVERGDYDAPAPPADGERGVYVKSSSPFTSGNLHMGHVRDYTIGDAYARFQRARGRDVLMGFGFDAFGLPAELAAIERQIPAAEWVEQCGERMLEQMKRLGYSFDYDRVFYSSDEGQYRWSQWLFLTLYEMGLIYLDDATVDWCDTCQTTLATIQVEEGGTCWRCHNEVRLIRKPTWFLKITPYLEENDANMALLESAALGRAGARHAALHPRSRRRGRDRPRRARRAADRLHPARRRRRAGELRPALAAPPARSRRWVGRRGARASSSSCARAAGSGAPATPKRCR